MKHLEHRLFVCCFTAIAVVLLVEAGTRYALNRDWLRDHSLVGTVEQYLAELRSEKPQIWLLGNSTLYYGVDVQALSKRVDSEAIALVHGSATLAGSADMASYYLRETDGKSEIKPMFVFCVTPDDLNRNGYRARVSEAYRDGIAPVQWVLGWLRLARCRSSILGSLQECYASTLGTKRESSTAPPTGTIKLDADWLRGLSANYEVDEDGLASLAALRHDGYRVVLVDMPVTAIYRDFFDSQSYGITVDEICSRLRVFCQEHDIVWIDLGEAIQDESLFRDPYHVSELRGRGVLTGLLGDRLGQTIWEIEGD